MRTEPDLGCRAIQKKGVLGRTNSPNSPTFPASHLFEVLEPNLMEINLSELTLT
jgi:hypothetical protein